MALTGATRIVTRGGGGTARELGADIAVLGAGIAGISAAIEAARLGRRVILIDAAPTLGGQSVGAIIGTFCGLFSNGPEPYQVTHGIADDILDELGARGALHYMRGRRNTTIVQYDEQALGRWIEETVRALPAITPLTGAVLRGVTREGRRLRAIELATRHGDVRVSATGFVDASGDAALAWQAGLACREPVTPIFGTQMVVLEGVDEAALNALDRGLLQSRLKERGHAYGLVREDGFVFPIPGTGAALVNMTHLAAPMDPVGASRQILEGRALADALLRFFKDEFPGPFAKAHIRTYAMPGIRQTRWIVGRHHLTADEVRAEIRTDDAIARCSWPIEYHDRPDGVHWEQFGDDHMHWVPLGSLVPAEADNLVAAGRCIDADSVALSSVRVMGPCIAMGAAAAHALDLAGSGAVGQIDMAALRKRLHDNLDRRD